MNKNILLISLATNWSITIAEIVDNERSVIYHNNSYTASAYVDKPLELIAEYMDKGYLVLCAEDGLIKEYKDWRG